MKRKVPHTYVIIFSIIVVAAIATWFVPGGEYERETKIVNGVEREVIVAGSFGYIQNQPQTWEIFSSFFSGFVNTANIIVFILMIGGAFWIMNESKAIDVGIFSLLRFTRKLEKINFIKYLGVDNIIIVLIMLMFSVFGAIFGMSEETIAFIIIFVPLSISMGYDSITGVSMCFVAAGLGFAGAILNPFTIGIAQGLSQIPLFSGIEYRMFAWLIINIVGIIYILRYVARIRKDPKKSLVYEEDEYWRSRGNAHVENIKYSTPKSSWYVFGLIQIVLIIYAVLFPMSTLKAGNASTTMPVLPFTAILFFITSILTLRKSFHFFVLNLLLFTIIFLIVGVMGYDWYVMEIATIFLAMGIAAGIAMGKSANDITKLFITGASDILSAAMVVGLAGGIIVILEDGRIIDTILYSISVAMQDFGKIASLSIMYLIQSFLNIIIPSGSGKAALTMPMMSQFSDLIEISRQATVMAFQFGDGFTNLITPTSGVLIGVLGVAKIPYEKWFRWVAPLVLILILLGLLLLIPTVTMELSGF
ncbi:MAG: YfcC family protein [Bacteroidales bacterium]